MLGAEDGALHNEGLQSSYTRLEAWEARLKQSEALAEQRAQAVTAKVS